LISRFNAFCRAMRALDAGAWGGGASDVDAVVVGVVIVLVGVVVVDVVVHGPVVVVPVLVVVVLRVVTSVVGVFTHIGTVTGPPLAVSAPTVPLASVGGVAIAAAVAYPAPPPARQRSTAGTARVLNGRALIARMKPVTPRKVRTGGPVRRSCGIRAAPQVAWLRPQSGQCPQFDPCVLARHLQ
jgi:hypothetical protein